MSGIAKLNFVALDSNIFIYFFESNPEFAKHINQIFEALLKNKLQAVTSIVAVIEALSYPSPPEVVTGIKEGFATLPNLRIVDVNKEIALEAAGIRRKYGFKLPDAVQLATALSVKAKVFITNDQRLKPFKNLKVLSLKEI